MEIERKYLVKEIPENLTAYPHHLIEQGYLSTNPVVRVRRQDEQYYLTYKGKGLLAREEYNLPLTAESYQHLLAKADGNIIRKTRYLLPVPETSYTVELDVFDPPFAPLVLAEIEFPTLEEANSFPMLPWFSEDVTENPAYHNSNMASRSL